MPANQGRLLAARPTASWATLAVTIGALAIIMGCSFVFLRP